MKKEIPLNKVTSFHGFPTKFDGDKPGPGPGPGPEPGELPETIDELLERMDEFKDRTLVYVRNEVQFELLSRDIVDVEDLRNLMIGPEVIEDILMKGYDLDEGRLNEVFTIADNNITVNTDAKVIYIDENHLPENYTSLTVNNEALRQLSIPPQVPSHRYDAIMIVDGIGYLPIIEQESEPL